MLMTANDQHNNGGGNNLVLFPAQFRVRCPRCGAAPQASPFSDDLVRYSCRSGDDFQSEICVQWEKDGVSEGLVADAREILSKFQFSGMASLRAVK